MKIGIYVLLPWSAIAIERNLCEVLAKLVLHYPHGHIAFPTHGDLFEMDDHAFHFAADAHLFRQGDVLLTSGLRRPKSASHLKLFL